MDTIPSPNPSHSSKDGISNRLDELVQFNATSHPREEANINVANLQTPSLPASRMTTPAPQQAMSQHYNEGHSFDGLPQFEAHETMYGSPFSSYQPDYEPDYEPDHSAYPAPPDQGYGGVSQTG